MPEGGGWCGVTSVILCSGSTVFESLAAQPIFLTVSVLVLFLSAILGTRLEWATAASFPVPSASSVTVPPNVMTQ
jgi:hypothetical protein